MEDIEIITLNEYVLTNIGLDGYYVIRLKDGKEYKVYRKKQNNKIINYILRDGKEISLNKDVLKLYISEIRIYERDGI